MEQPRIEPTIEEGKRLWSLVGQYAKLEMVDKLTFVLTLLIVGGMMLGLCTIAIYCFSMFFVTKLAEHTGDMALSYCIVGFILLLLAVIILLLRSVIVTTPLIKSLMRKFFEEEES